MTTRRHLPAIATLLVAALAMIAIHGCNYTTARPFPANVRTVYVEMFRSKEFRRDLEFQLTEAIQKRILMDTDYKLADKNRADTMLSGQVLEVRQATLGTDFRRDLPRETQTTFIVSFRWKDLRTGTTLVDRPRFTQTVDYIRPVGEDFFDASQEGLDDLAERIVEQMQSDW
jgi:hypothetical protein